MPSTSSPIHTLLESVGSKAIPVGRGTPTAGHSGAISTVSDAQVVPLSVDRNSPGVLGVPVPASMVPALAGSKTTDQTTCRFMGVSSKCQLSPAFSDRYKP